MSQEKEGTIKNHHKLHCRYSKRRPSERRSYGREGYSKRQDEAEHRPKPNDN